MGNGELTIIICELDGTKRVDIFKDGKPLHLFKNEKFDKVTVYEEETQ